MRLSSSQNPSESRVPSQSSRSRAARKMLLIRCRRDRRHDSCVLPDLGNLFFLFLSFLISGELAIIVEIGAGPTSLLLFKQTQTQTSNVIHQNSQHQQQPNAQGLRMDTANSVASDNIWSFICREPSVLPCLFRQPWTWMLMSRPCWLSSIRWTACRFACVASCATDVRCVVSTRAWSRDLVRMIRKSAHGIGPFLHSSFCGVNSHAHFKVVYIPAPPSTTFKTRAVQLTMN
jgi:hypothetical protein